MKATMRAVVSLALIVGLWETVARRNWISPSLFPPPTTVLIALGELARSGDLARDLAASLWRAAAGFAWGAVAGVAVGLVTGRGERVNDYVAPVINALRPLPPVAIIPLVIVWMGISDLAKVFSIGFAVFFPVWVNTHLGAHQVPRTLLWTANILGVRGIRLFAMVILPGSLPYVVAGCRSGISMAFIMVYVSELAGASSGIGYQISVSHLAYRIDRMIAALLVLGTCGAVADLLVRGTFRLLFPWLRFTSYR